MALKDTLKEMLKDKGLTQLDIAEKMDMAKTNLNNKIQRDSFSVVELVKIADALDMQLVFKDGEKEYSVEYTEEEKKKPRRVDKKASTN